MVILNDSKLRVVAEFARFCNANQKSPDDILWRQMLGISIRKLHDHGQSSLGVGKYLGHPYWSTNAVKLLRQNRLRVNGITGLLSHEHVVPVSIQVQKLLALPDDTPLSGYETVIRGLSLVAILTREEDKILRGIKYTEAPFENWIDIDPWWRYRAAGLFDQILDFTGQSSLDHLVC